MKRDHGTVEVVGIGNVSLRVDGSLLRSVPISGELSLLPGDQVGIQWVGERPYVTSLMGYRQSGTDGTAVPQVASEVVEVRTDPFTLKDESGSTAIPDADGAILMQGSGGVVATAGGSTVFIAHDVGNFGDLHINYTEHEVAELITADWTWDSGYGLHFREAGIRIYSDADNRMSIATPVLEGVASQISITSDLVAITAEVTISDDLVVSGKVAADLATAPTYSLEVGGIAALYYSPSVYSLLSTLVDGTLSIEATGDKVLLESGHTLSFNGAGYISTVSDNLTLAPFSEIRSSKNLQFTGDNYIYEQYTSGAFGAGYAIGYNGTESYLEVDNVTVRGALRTHIFQKDIVRATNGYLYIADATEITHPAEGSYIFVKEAVFQTGDLVWYKDIDLGESIVSHSVKMTVTTENTPVVKNDQTVYQYTVTVNEGSIADLDAAGTIVRVGNTTSAARQGALFMDASSTYAPFMDVYDGVASWTDFGSTAKVKARLGKVSGITLGTNDYGLFAGDGYSDTAKYVLASSVSGFKLNNMPLTMYDGTNTVVRIESTGPYLGIGVPAPQGYLSTYEGFWAGQDSGAFKMFIGDGDAERLQYDSSTSTLGIYDLNGDAVFTSGPSGSWMSSLMVSQSLGQFLVSGSDGLSLWGPGCEMTSAAWKSTRGHVAVLSGAFHQEQGRWAGTSGLVFEAGTTNYIIDGSFEHTTLTDFWGNSGCTTFERNATMKVFGSYSLHVVTDATTDVAYSDAISYCDAGETWTVSCYVYIVSGDFKLYVYQNIAGWTLLGSVTESELGKWKRVVFTGTLSTGATDLTIQIGANTTAASEFYVDGVQVEEMVVATSYCDGSLGSGYAFQTPSLPHQTYSIRTSSTCSLTGVRAMLNSNSTFSIRVVAQVPYDADATWHNTYPVAWTVYGGGLSSLIQLTYSTADDYFYLYINGGSRIITPVQTFSAGDWLDFVMTFDFTNDVYTLYINGEQAGDPYTGALSTATLTTWRLAGRYDGTAHWGGTIAEHAVFDRVLTADEVASIYALGRPLVDSGAMDSPGIYILDGKFSLASSTSLTRLELNSSRLAIGSGISYGGVGCWLGLDAGTPKFSVYNDSSNYILWDGANLAWGCGTSSLSAAGAITCTSGTIGGWTLGSTTLSSSNVTLNASTSSPNPSISIGNTTFGQTGIQLQYYGGSPRAFIGGSNASLEYTSTGLTLTSGGGAIKITPNANILFHVASANQGLAWYSDSGFTTACGALRVNTSTNDFYIDTGSGALADHKDFYIQTLSSSGTRKPLWIDAENKRLSIYDGHSSAPDGGATLSIRNGSGTGGDGTWAVIYAQQWSVRSVAHFDNDGDGPAIRLDANFTTSTKTIAGYVLINVNGDNRYMAYYNT